MIFFYVKVVVAELSMEETDSIKKILKVHVKSRMVWNKIRASN